MALRGLCGASVGFTPTRFGARKTTLSKPRAPRHKVAALHQEAQTPAQTPSFRATAIFPCTLSLSALLSGNSALAEEVADAAASTSQGFGLNPAEIALLSAPPLLYGIFSLYRANVNDQAKLSDFLSIIAAAIIIGNLVSAIVFKVRLY